MNLFKKVVNILVYILILIIILSVSKGNLGDSLNEVSEYKKQGQVFESSISRGRYALLLAIVESKRTDLSEKLAMFSKPDVAKISENKYISVWPPGTIFYLLPFYLLGRNFNLGLISTSFGIGLLAYFNFILIIRICKKLKLSENLSFLSALIFIFSTNALVYSGFINQHHLTTFILLLMINASINNVNVVKLFALSLLYGLGIIVDLPNSIILLPPLAYVFYKVVFDCTTTDNKTINMKIKYWNIIGVIALIIPLLGLLLFNYSTTGNCFSFGQRYSRLKSSEQAPSSIRSFGSFIPFNTDDIDKNIVVLTTGYERGILIFSPVIILALFGISNLIKRNKEFTVFYLLIIINVFLMYSVFGDVRGGWSFGPRYLIPAFPLLSIFVVSAVEKYKKNLLFNLIFILTSIYSILLSLLGALTTILIPPLAETTGTNMDSTYLSNITFLREKELDSFVYKILFKQYLNNIQYFLMIASVILIVFFINYYLILKEN